MRKSPHCAWGPGQRLLELPVREVSAACTCVDQLALSQLLALTDVVVSSVARCAVFVMRRSGVRAADEWIQASYNPTLDRNGKVCKVIKFATDITAEKLGNMEDAGMIAAIGRAQR
jgi:hypothetical protein